MNKIKTKKSILTLALSLALGSTFISSSLSAEESNKVKSSSSDALFEVIEVNARKMQNAESIQETPLAISAFGEKQLDALHVSNLSDLSFSSPNVQFDEIGTIPGVQNFSFRGQGINSSIPSVDPTVGTFIDGMFLGTSYGVVLDIFDIESIEILRGPQGLIFGRNVTGGAVNIRTKRPGDEFNASFKAGLTNGNEYTIAGTVEGELIEDKLRGKFVFYRNDDSGNFDYTGSGQQDSFTIPGTTTTITPQYFSDEREQTGEMTTELFRGTLVYDATENLEFTLIGEMGSMKGDGAIWQTTSTILDASTGEYIDNPSGEFETAGDEGGLTDGEWSHLILETNYEYGDGVITNISAYREIDFLSVFDLDGSPTPIFALSGTTKQHQFSNELRYASSAFDGKLDYTFGHYYFEQTVSYLEGRLIFGGAKPVALGGDMDHTASGVFMSGDYHLTDQLTITAGARYTKEEKEASVIGSSNGVCTDVYTFKGCERSELARKWSSVTPKVGFDYKFNKNSLMYAFWTKGFRSGGVNFRNAKPNLFNPGPTDAESQNAYEMGFKNDFFDNHLRLNSSFFFNDISDIQREINVSDPDVVVLQATLNAGDAEIKGFEVDFLAAISDNFTLSGSVGVLDAEYTYKKPETAEQFGDDLPRLSPFSYAISANYTVELDDNGYIDIQMGYSYKDRAAYTDSNSAYFPEARELTTNISWSNLDENINISFYGKNLLDESRWGNITGSGVWGPQQKGRVLGVEVKYSYF